MTFFLNKSHCEVLGGYEFWGDTIHPTLVGKGLCCAEGIRVPAQLTLTQGEHPGLRSGPSEVL